MGGGCEVERGENSDKVCLSYFVTRFYAYNICVLALNSVGAVARILGQPIAHQRDDDIREGTKGIGDGML